jgi:hypothetical protein
MDAPGNKCFNLVPALYSGRSEAQAKLQQVPSELRSLR